MDATKFEAHKSPVWSYFFLQNLIKSFHFSLIYHFYSTHNLYENPRHKIKLIRKPLFFYSVNDIVFINKFSKNAGIWIIRFSRLLFKTFLNGYRCNFWNSKWIWATFWMLPKTSKTHLLRGFVAKKSLKGMNLLCLHWLTRDIRIVFLVLKIPANSKLFSNTS